MSPFKQLLAAAGQQPEPQRLLILLTKTERSNKSSKSVAKGTISPVMCVDKLPTELSSFEDFKKEADSISKNWDMMVIAGMSGHGNIAPTSEEAEPVLNKMANDVVQGQDLSRYFILDRNENRIEMVAR